MQYTSFKVTTHSTNPKFKCCNASNAVVMRRFSEFHMLFRKLRSDFPGTVVPPCPEKNQMQKLRKTPEFIEARRQALEVFVNKLCCHRALRQSDLLRNFLEADEPSWTMEMHRLKQSEEQGTMLGTVTQLASDLMHSTKNLTKGQSDDKGEEPEYLQVHPAPRRVLVMIVCRQHPSLLRAWAAMRKSVTCGRARVARCCFTHGAYIFHASTRPPSTTAARSPTAGRSLQYKEYSTHLEHHLKDACSRSADFVAKQQAYGDALAAFGAQASNMSKYEESTAASAFSELHATSTAVAELHKDVSSHVNRCAAMSRRDAMPVPC